MTLELIDGVKIECYSTDHPPPHIHAKYGEAEDRIIIATGEIMEGSDLPKRKRKIAVKYVLENIKLLNKIFELMNPQIKRNAKK